MILLVVYAHSRWMIVNVASTQNTKEHLHSIFARFGLPKIIVTDNGSCFTSSGFAKFARHNQICYLRSAPHYSFFIQWLIVGSAVQAFKLGTLQPKLSRFLFHYRLTPNATTAVAPAELMLNRQPRSDLDSIRPNLTCYFTAGEAKESA